MLCSLYLMNKGNFVTRRGNLGAGNHQLQLNSPPRLIEGYYYLHLSTANENEVIPLIIER